MKRKALVFIDYDLLIRHFIMNGTFKELERSYEVTYVFHHDSTSEKQGIYAELAGLGLQNYIRFEVPRARMGSWDKLYSITTLYAQRGTSNFRPRKELMAMARGRLRTFYYHMLSLPGIYHFMRARLTAKMGVYEPLLEFVRQQQPHIIFHPSILAGYFINELLIISKRLSIPLVAMMNSWDNPSSKAMNTGLPDKLVVWGPQTVQHAIKYLGMPARNIVAFGAAQFQLYREPVQGSDLKLRELFKVPTSKPILLYAGVSKSINESRHLEIIDAAIATGSIPPCHVIYRPHPWRGSLVPGEKSFFDLSLQHITIDPHMEDYYTRIVRGRVPGFELADYNVTKKLLHLVDGVISPLSTILLESVIFGKPVLMFSSNVGKCEGRRAVDIGVKLAHFRDFWGAKGVEICHEESGLPHYCKQLLLNSQDEAIRLGLKEHASKFIIMDGPSYGERLAMLADELMSCK